MTHGSYNVNRHILFFSSVVGLNDSRPGGTADNKGFTLVELLIVVALIGILATLSIPTYNGYVNTTRNRRAMSEIRTLSTEISGYFLDKGSNPPDLDAIGRNNFLDPWKRPYVYSRVPVLEEPMGTYFLNSDFDVYSKGIDGAGLPAGGDLGNKDDIVRSGTGAFIGLRESFSL